MFRTPKHFKVSKAADAIQAAETVFYLSGGQETFEKALERIESTPALNAEFEEFFCPVQEVRDYMVTHSVCTEELDCLFQELAEDAKNTQLF